MEGDARGSGLPGRDGEVLCVPAPETGTLGSEVVHAGGFSTVRPLRSSTQHPFIHLQEEANSIEPTVARLRLLLQSYLILQGCWRKIHFNAMFKRAVIFNIVNGFFKRVM